jgi:DNA-binding winged helix-turn-helix (wHTH) protein
MSTPRLVFGDFVLDAADRSLARAGERVELGGRYLDALVLLANSAGALVTKQRFMDEVWRGIPVTDEALTQCVRVLRQSLGDDAAAPRFIETVPRHGYRFIAAVQEEGGDLTPVPHASGNPAPGRASFLALLARGAAGAGAAGLLTGLFYGLVGASAAGTGGAALSMVLVLVCVSVLAAVVAGGGITAGLAAARCLPAAGWLWTTAAGALGGALLGAFAHLLGLDAFLLLTGRSPGRIAGALEGALLGAAIGMGLWLASSGRSRPLAARVAPATGLGALAGLLVALAGGTMMGGSLQSLVDNFPQSRFRLDSLGRAFGEDGFGDVARMVTSAAEGALFATCIVAALVWRRRV